MTLAAQRWPRSAAAGSDPGPAVRGVGIVWRWEVAKLARQVRVRAVGVACLAVPFLMVGVFTVQSSVPQDTLFGAWIHESGLALPLVMLGFAGQWVLPVLTSVVSGDIFSSEDHFGTWKTVLTRSRSRGEVFTGKLLAALTYSLAMLTLLAGSSIVAGLLSGPWAVVGLSGQAVPPSRAVVLVVASWATQVAPLCGFCVLSVLLSIISRNSLVGIGVPVLAGLVMQVCTLVNMPVGVRGLLIGTPFAAWHGLWTQTPYYGPTAQGLLTSGGWFGICGLAAWLVFRRRSVRVG